MNRTKIIFYFCKQPLLLMVYLWLSIFSVFAATGKWTGNTNSDWNNSANWTGGGGPGGRPANGDRVRIDPANYTGVMAFPIILANSVFSPSRVDVQNGGRLDIQANLTTSGRFRVRDLTSLVNMSVGTTLNINGGNDLRVEKDGVFNLTGGTINVSKKMKVDRGGTYNMSGGALNVTDILQIKDLQAVSSTFNMSGGITNITKDVELDAAGVAAIPVLNISGGIFNANRNLFWIDNTPTVESPHLIVSGGIVTIARDASRDVAPGGPFTTKIDIDISGGIIVFQGNLIMDDPGALDRLDQTGGIIQFDGVFDWTNSGTYLATAGTAVFNGTTRLRDATFLGAWQFFNLTINAGMQMTQTDPPNINVAGNWANNGGTFVEGTQKVTINGSIAQSITATGGENFYDLTINKSAGVLTLNSNVTTSITTGGTLAMTSGNIDCLTNVLTLGTSTANVGILVHPLITSGTIKGKFKRWINATGTWLFPVGTLTNYRSDNLVINTLTTSGNLTVEFIAVDPGLLPGCPGGCSLIDAPRTMINSFTEGYWRQTVGGGLAASDYSLRLRGEAFISRFMSNLTRILKGTIGAWGLDGTHAALVGVTAKRNNLIGGLGSDFCLSETECAVPNPGISGANSVCKNAAVTYSVTGGLAGSTYNWIITGGLPATGTGTSINVTWGNTGGAANVRVIETTAANCFNMRIFDYPVTINPVPTSVITGSTGTCPNTLGVAYSVTATAGYTYVWTITGGSQTSGTTTNSITVDWGAGPTGQVDVIATSPSCGADAMQSLPVSIGSYSSSAVTQALTTTVGQGSFNQQILRIAVVTLNCTTGSATQFNFSTAGTPGSTAPVTDIANAHVYYTGTSTAFSTSFPFGSLGVAPNGAFTINGVQALTQNATNYFWLVYDINLTATAGNDVDAQLTSFVYEGSTFTNASTPDPAGKRTITAVTQYWSMASAGWNAGKNNVTWSTDFGVSTCNCEPTAGADYVVIRNGHTVILDNANRTIGDLLIQSGGVLMNDGTASIKLTLNQTLTIQGTGFMNLDRRFTANGNATLRGTGASISSDRLTFNAVLDVGNGASLTETGNRITVVGDFIVNGTVAIQNGNDIRLDGNANISGTGIVTSNNNADRIQVRNAPRTVLTGTNLTIQPYFEIRNAVTVTNKGIINLVFNGVNTQGDLDGKNTAAVWLNDVNSTLNYGGVGTMFANVNTRGTLTASAVGNTVNYNYAGNQVIITPNISTYYHLTASVSGTKNALASLAIINGDLTSQNAAVLTLAALTDINGNVNILNTGVFNPLNNNITVAGNWTNSSTNVNPFVEGTATVTLDGAAAQTILRAADETFNNLTINNTLGGISLGSATDVFITNILTLTNGIIDGRTNASRIMLPSTASVAGGSASSFVDGIVRKTGNTPFVFPIGNGITWARLGITAPDNVGDVFEVNYTLGPHIDANNTDITLNNSSIIEYWNLTEVADVGAVTSANITLYFESAANSGISDFVGLDLVVGHYTGGKWVNAGQSAISGTNPGTVTSNALTTFSPFTFGSGNSAVNPLPIELIAFNAELLNGEVQLDWTTASEINNDYFTIERTVDGLNYEWIAEVAGAGNSNKKLNYTTYDYSPLEGLSYYRLKQTDFDGEFDFSNLVLIENNHASESSILFNVFPNPVVNSTNAQLQIKGVNKNAKVLVVVRNVLGQLIYSKIVITDNNGSAILAVDPTHKLSSGTYLITGSTNNNLFSKKLIIR